MRICFVWWFKEASKIKPFWHDGLSRALEIVGEKHQVDWYLDCKLPKVNKKYDWLLFWGDSNCPVFDILNNYKCKKGIFLTTDPYNRKNMKKLDVIFCESTPICQTLKNENYPVVLAFGTDTEFYSPDESVKKDIEYLCIGTFSPWKRQSAIANLGDKLVCIGTIQPDGMNEYQACVDAGVQVKVGYFPAGTIRDYYRRAEAVIVPAIHGSERTVLEGMSMNLLPLTIQGNIRASSYVNEYLASKDQYKDPRDFVIKNYSAEIYAQRILENIESE